MHRQIVGATIELLTVIAQCREPLRRLREHVCNRIELVAGAAGVDVDGIALLRDRHDDRIGLTRNALCRAVPRACLGCRQARIGHQVHVGTHDVLELGIKHDRAVHFGELVQHLRRERHVELDATRDQRRDLIARSNNDQRAKVSHDDVVDAETQIGARRKQAQRTGETRVSAWIDQHLTVS